MVSTCHGATSHGSAAKLQPVKRLASSCGSKVATTPIRSAWPALGRAVQFRTATGIGRVFPQTTGGPVGGEGEAFGGVSLPPTARGFFGTFGGIDPQRLQERAAQLEAENQRLSQQVGRQQAGGLSAAQIAQRQAAGRLGAAAVARRWGVDHERRWL